MQGHKKTRAKKAHDEPKHCIVQIFLGSGGNIIVGESESVYRNQIQYEYLQVVYYCFVYISLAVDGPQRVLGYQSHLLLQHCHPARGHE